MYDNTKVQQSNCHYQLLDKAPNTPVTHRSEDGVVYLTPVWSSDHNSSALVSAQLHDANAINAKWIPKGTSNLYYFFFRVSCYEDSVTSQVIRNSWTAEVDSKLDKLIFQHSFYVYISIAKYPF